MCGEVFANVVEGFSDDAVAKIFVRLDEAFYPVYFVKIVFEEVVIVFGVREFGWSWRFFVDDVGDLVAEFGVGVVFFGQFGDMLKMCKFVAEILESAFVGVFFEEGVVEFSDGVFDGVCFFLFFGADIVEDGFDDHIL